MYFSVIPATPDVEYARFCPCNVAFLTCFLVVFLSKNPLFVTFWHFGDPDPAFLAFWHFRKVGKNWIPKLHFAQTRKRHFGNFGNTFCKFDEVGKTFSRFWQFRILNPDFGFKIQISAIVEKPNPHRSQPENRC